MLGQSATNSKQSFLNFLAEIGLQKTWMYHSLDFLLEEQEDYDEYINNFWDGDIDKLFLTVCTFRNHLLNKKKMSLEQFIHVYNIDKCKALEQLFQHRVYPYMLDLIKRRNMSPEQLYQLHEENQVVPLLRFVL